MSEPILLVAVFEGDELIEAHSAPRSAILADNSEDPDVCAAVLGLKVGGSVRLGGGAAPLVVVGWPVPRGGA